MIKSLLKRLVFATTLLALFFTHFAYAQSINVSGTVSDAQGAVPGVSVTVKGTTSGTLTDADGKFRLNVDKESDVIVISSVGYQSRELPVGTNRNFSVILKESLNDLKEVVVVGFGQQTKGDVNAAVGTIKAADIVKSPVGNVTNALTGRVAGLLTKQPQGRPGASAANIYIRGRASTNSDALIVVDGVERETFGDIDPNDIESISVLKDAGSTALFGLKGANGVIVVTTKRGTPGKPQISYSGQFGLNTFGQRPEPLRAYQSAMLHNQGEDNLAAAGLLDPSYVKYFTPQDLEIFKSGTGDPLLYPDVDWFDELTQDAWVRTQQNLSFRGGSNKVGYFVSLGYMFEDGFFKNFNTPLGYKTNPYAKRGNFRSNLDYKLTKTTTLSLNLAGRIESEYTNRIIKFNQTAPENNNKTGAEAAFKYIYITPSWAIPFNRDATERKTPEQRAIDDTYNQIVGVGFGPNLENPYVNLKRAGYSQSETNTLESTFIISQKLDFITKGLDFRGTFAYDQASSAFRTQFGAGAQYTVNRATGEIIPANNPPSNLQIEDGLNSRNGAGGGNLKTNVLAQINYSRAFGKNKINAALVGSRELKSQTIPVTFQGMVFKSAYNRDDKYFLELNASYQGSENFAEGFRYGFFPTAVLGYTLTNEKFMEGIKEKIALDYLKLRGSIGLTGFSNAGRFLYRDGYGNITTGSLGNFQFGNPSQFGAAAYDPRPGQGNVNTNVPTYGHSQFGNPFVTFEKGLKRNIAVDANFLKDRIQFTVDVFDEVRSDVLLSRNASTLSVYGESTPSYNYGENYNAGYETELRLSNQSGNFNYGLNFQFSHIKNERRIIDEPINLQGNLKRAGLPIGQFIGYDVAPEFFQNQAEVDAWAKLAGFPFIPGDLKLIDQNNDGVLDGNDFTKIGYTDLPVNQYSLEPRVSYKNFSLSALFQAVDQVSSEFNLIESDNIFLQPQYYAFQLDSWTPQNPSAKYPAVRPGNFKNSFFSKGSSGINKFNLQDASYIKLRNISLNYQVPTKFASKIGLSRAVVGITGQNLYTWTKFIGLDPENDDDRSVGTYVNRGITYPNIRTFQLNLNVTF